MGRKQIKRALILSAGMGTRLRPYTDNMPKPLIKVGEKPILQRILNDLEVRGFEEVVINVHYLADQVMRAVNAWPTQMDIYFSEEPELLGVGGGIRQAFDIIGDDQPLLVVNGDCVMKECETPLYNEMIQAFDDSKMDALLALSPWDKVADILAGDGFFTQNDDGQITLRKPNENVRDLPRYAYASVQVIHPRLVKKLIVGKKANLGPIWRDAQEKEKLFGFVYDGDWADMGSHRGLHKAEEVIAVSKKAS